MSKEIVIITGTVLDENTKLTLVELCQFGKTSAEYVIEMVEEGVLEVEGLSPPDWRFDAIALKRLQSATRLQRDLKINLPGVALALDLLDELETLRHRIHD